MFRLNELRQARVYQEAKEEGRQEAKLEAVSQLLVLGLTVEQIAQALNLPVEIVRQVAQKANNKDNESPKD